MSPPPFAPGDGPASEVSAVPDDLRGYSSTALQIDSTLAEPVQSFWRAMSGLRLVAATADPRIPQMVSATSEENDAVSWLARAEQVDGWVAKVAQAFVAADGPSPLQGPEIQLSVNDGALASALAALESAAPNGLQVTGGKLRGPDGQLYDVVVPPMVNGQPVDVNAPYCVALDPSHAYDADHVITPDDLTSMAQTDDGMDPGWVTVGNASLGVTAINPPSKLDYLAAIVAPGLEAFGEPAGPSEYRSLLEELSGNPQEPESPSGGGGLPPDDPFLTDRDDYTPPPGVPMPEMGNQETVDAGVGALTQIDESLGNVVHLKNGALAAYHATFERNVDGRTRAIVRLYRIGIPPGGSDSQTTVSYGSVDPHGHWTLTPIQAKPPPPGVSMGPP